jgi:hypothetical protein
MKSLKLALSHLILKGNCYSTVSMLALNTCLVGLSQRSYTRWLYKCDYASRAESVTVIKNMNLFEHTSTRTRLIKAIGNTTCTYEDLSGSMNSSKQHSRKSVPCLHQPNSLDASFQ